MIVLAQCKLNLTLHVTGQRADGYHLLDSLVAFPFVGDGIRLEPANEMEIIVDGPFAEGVPTGPDNLIWRAIDLMAPPTAYHVLLTKRLPHGAGIGGGSADAAAVMRALAKEHDQPLPGVDALMKLGADLPVCMHRRPTFLRGVGEEISPAPQFPLPAQPSLHTVLVNPGKPVPTPACFARLKRKDNPPMTAHDWRNVPSFYPWLAAQRNDLQEPAMEIVPEIEDCLIALRGTDDCLLARMSGSGATCFGLYPRQGQAEQAAAALRAAHPNWWVVDCPIPLR